MNAPTPPRQGLPLRKPKIEQAPVSDPPTVPSENDERPLAGTPEQGGEDDGSGFVPPPPERPDGSYRAKVSQVNRWVNKEGKVAINPKTQQPSIPVVVFQIVDPKEAEKAKRGKPSCYMSEDASFRLDFTSQWYSQTVRFLAEIGCGESTWPKGKIGPNNPHGRPSMAQLADHVMNTTRGKEFVIECKVEAGKGEFKDRPFCRLKKVTRYQPPVAAAKQPPPRAAAPAEGTPADSPDGEDIPF
jgi:hypothetical protein